MGLAHEGEDKRLGAAHDREGGARITHFAQPSVDVRDGDPEEVRVDLGQGRVDGRDVSCGHVAQFEMGLPEESLDLRRLALRHRDAVLRAVLTTLWTNASLSMTG